MVRGSKICNSASSCLGKSILTSILLSLFVSGLPSDNAFANSISEAAVDSANAGSPLPSIGEKPSVSEIQQSIKSTQQEVTDQRRKDIEDYREVLKKNPADNKAKRDLATLYAQFPETTGMARTLFEQLRKAHEDSDTLMDLASVIFKSDFDETYRICQKAERLNNGKFYTLAMIKLGLGGSRYRSNDLVLSEKYYKESLASLTKNDPPVTPRLALVGLAGVSWRAQKYQESADYYLELYRLNRDIYGAQDLECGWSLLEASYAMSKLSKDDRGRPFYERAIWIFREHNCKYLISEYEKKHQVKASPEIVERIKSVVFGAALGTVPPDPVPLLSSKYTGLVKSGAYTFFSAWRTNFKHLEAPSWVWFDPDVPVKYVLLCVHGLGLHHGAYAPFAKRVAREGVLTVAMDVRGFGTFAETNGFENVSMNDCVADLKSLARLLRKDYPDLPVFILGESMGGALALRVVSEAPDAVDGLICSVPSGSRHKGFTTALSVGADYLRNKRKPTHMGAQVVNQATKNKELRAAWMSDPSSRLALSPEELLNFQKFMDHNVRCARAIDKTPVIIFQGHNDKLVKEKGSLDLFEALATHKKSIVILGNTEHLIFEDGQFGDDLTMAVMGWMSAFRDAKLHSETSVNH